MAYNLDSEERIDRLVDRFGEITKKKMFGGVGYMLGGNICFGIHKEYLVLRTSPERAEMLLKDDSFSVFDITGRPMKGWLLVSPDVLEAEDQLLKMLKLGADYTIELPKK